MYDADYDPKELRDAYFETIREQEGQKTEADHLVEIEAYARENNVPVIGRGTGDIIRYYLRSVAPENVLEIGTAIGYSALFMREYLSVNAHITTIEKIESRYTLAENNFKKYDKDNKITLIKEDAGDAIEKLRDNGNKYGVIFLDAAKGQYPAYLPVLVDLLETGGVIITDNIFHNGAVINSRYAVTQRDRTIHDRLREYMKDISENEGLNTLILPVEDGVAICQKK